METKKITKEFFIENASAREVYELYTDPVKHSAVIAADAEIIPEVGVHFSAWGGSINGKILELEEGKRVVQTWRSENKKWPEDYFSKLTLIFDDVDKGAKITLIHEGVPSKDEATIADGWEKYYFKEFKGYFLKEALSNNNTG